MTDYGPLAGLVGSAGSLLAAGGAITVAWVRKAKWAPPEDDVPAGPARVASLLTTIAIAWLWFETGKGLHSRALEVLAAAGGGITLVSLLVYSSLIAIYVYQREVAVSSSSTETRRTIGGFWLTANARAALEKAKTIQRVFTGSGYDPDLVWPRASRALVKVLFIISFMGLQVSGSIALASITLSVDPAAGAGP
jgi:hypothetical protein